MAISEFEIKRIEKLVGAFVEEKRPSQAIRDQLDFSFKIEGQSFEIFEIRPKWNDPTQSIHSPIAKATYVKSTKLWKLYWMRADMKWHKYEPLSLSKSLEEVLATIKEDKYHCFFG